MGKSLQRLEEKKRNLGMKKLGECGIDVERWLAMLDADPAAMQRLATAWPIFVTPYVYDAVALFGFGSASPEPLPEAKSGELIIRYGGWSPQELRDSEIGQRLMHQQDWYNEYAWSTEKLPPGIYRLRIPVSDSNRKNAAEQERIFPKGEEFAPVVLVESALLAHFLQTGEDLLKTDWTRCKERTDGDSRVELYWRDGRLRVGHNVRWVGDRRGRLWASSVRISES